MDQEEYFKCQCVTHASYESQIEKYANGQRRALEWFFEGVDKHSRVLDSACGDGVGMKWFLDNGYTAVGVEMNPDKAEAASNYGEVYKFDMHDLSGLPGLFDVVWTSHSLEHCHDPIKVLNEFKTHMNSGSKLFIVLPYPDTTTVDAHIGNRILKTNMDNVMAFIDLLKENFVVDEWKLDDVREQEVWVKAHKD